jgi:hypothetical protein
VGFLVRLHERTESISNRARSNSGVAPPHPVQNQMLIDAIRVRRGFKSCPEDRAAATVVVIELLLKGFAGARNQHYLQLWRPAA